MAWNSRIVREVRANTEERSASPEQDRKTAGRGRTREKESHALGDSERSCHRSQTTLL